MGEVADVVGGGTPKTDQAEYFGGEIPWITPADLSGYSEKFISHGQRNITKAGLGHSGARLLPAGTVLFSSRAPIGYVAIAANPVSTNQGFKSFVLREGLKADYVYYYLQHAKKIAFELASGTTFLEISGKKAAQIPVPIPSIDEQHQIVAEIEKQFTRLEAGIAALKRVQANLKRYRAAVLKAACEGHIVPTEAELSRQEDRAYETGEQLRARILTERRQKWQGRGKYKEPAAPNIAALSPLPEGWTWATVSQIGETTTGFTPPKQNAEFFGGDIPFFKPTDLDAGYYVRKFRDSLTEAGAEQGRVLPARSILVTCIGATIGKTGFSRIRCATNQQINALTVSPDYLSPEFVFWFFTSTLGQRQITENASATTLPILNKSRFVVLPIPIPPLAEQERIVAEVERRLSVVEEQEAVVAANLQRAARLRQSILQRAFTGKLVYNGLERKQHYDDDEKEKGAHHDHPNHQ